MHTLRNSTAWIVAAAMVVSCGKRERSETSVQSGGPAPSPPVAPARVVPDMPDVRSVAAALKAIRTRKNATIKLIDIRDALDRLAETSGTSYGACLCQMYDILSEGESEAKGESLVCCMVAMDFEDQDRLLSMLASARPGPLLDAFASRAVDGGVKACDLGAVYKLMPESSAREGFSVEWVGRTNSAEGLAAAMALVDSLEAVQERKEALVHLSYDLANAVREGRPVSDVDISALRDKARAVGVNELLMETIPQTNK